MEDAADLGNYLPLSYKGRKSGGRVPFHMKTFWFNEEVDAAPTFPLNGHFSRRIQDKMNRPQREGPNVLMWRRLQ